MKRIVLVVVITAALIWPALASAKLHKFNESYHRLHDEISLINLVNGLFLSDEQRTELVKIAKEADRERQRAEALAEAKIDRSVRAMEQVKTALMRGDSHPKDAVKEANLGREAALEVMKDHLLRRMELERRAAAVLTENQIAVIEGFKPCLVPPTSPTNPSPAGSAGHANAFERILVRLYDADPRTLDRQLNRFMNRHLRKLDENIGPLSTEQVDRERQRLGEIVAQARAMERTEFEVNKAQLAERIIEPVTEFEAERDTARKRMHQGWRTGKVGRWLLDPALISILEKP